VAAADRIGLAVLGIWSFKRRTFPGSERHGVLRALQGMQSSDVHRTGTAAGSQGASTSLRPAYEAFDLAPPAHAGRGVPGLDVNAWVAQVERKSGWSKKRVMGIGLPLLQLVTISQFEAILAHEFGHYDGGDTSLGPWIYRTRQAIRQTIQRLSAAASNYELMALIRAPFLGYGKISLRITHAVSRAQEFSADRLAAETIGAGALADGLRSIHRGAAAGSYYLNSARHKTPRLGRCHAIPDLAE
jgi:Zn-dependent protease with chaperone function